MRKILAPFLALIFALWSVALPATAMLTVSELHGFNAGGEPPASFSFVGCTTSLTAGSTHTFTNHATGTAGNRKTIVGVNARDTATNFNIASMTVGGAAAAEQVDNAAATGSLVQSAIYTIDNPSGTTATIAVTFSESVPSTNVCVWAAYDLISETATDTASQFQTLSDAITLDLDIPVGGIALGVSSVAALVTATWVGMNERSDVGFDGTNPAALTIADSSTSGVPTTVSVDWTGTADSVGVSASFR